MSEVPALDGWEAIVRDYRRGQRTWPIEGAPDANPTTPWPLRWVCAEPDPTPGSVGWRSVEAVCIYSGRPVNFQKNGIRCARCGRVMHDQLAAAHTGLYSPNRSVPSCLDCRDQVEVVA